MSPLSFLMVDTLSSNEPASDETARRALREFLSLVLESDGPAEVRRLIEVFRCKIEAVCPARDFADHTPDGDLKVPLAKAASVL